jgi:integrase
VHQVNLAFKSLDCIGRSKSARKKSGKPLTGIYSGQTMKNYINWCCTFVHWAREHYGVKHLIELNHDIGRAYFAHLQEKNCSPYTLKSVRSALLKLEIGIARAFHRRVRIVPRDLVLPRRSIQSRQGRFAYTEEQVRQILSYACGINLAASLVLTVQSRFGLRISEALKLRKTDVRENVLVVFRGKGGRKREIPIETPEQRELLALLCRDKGEMDLLFPGLTARSVERVLEKACALSGIEFHKTHNLRHYYAVKKYDEKVSRGESDRRARKEVSQLLGHNRVGVTYAYAPPRIRPRDY